MFATEGGNKENLRCAELQLLFLHEQRFTEIKCTNPLNKAK